MKPRILDPAVVFNLGRQIHLPALPTAPSQARRFVTNTLTTWSLSQDHIDTAVLLTSELVTNAVTATGRTNGPPEPGPTEHINAITVWARHSPETGTIIAVWDNHPSPPVIPDIAPDSDTHETGRGLHLITTLATTCGYYHTQHGGKITWCQIV